MVQYLPLEIYKDNTPLVQTEFVSMANYALLPMISYPIALKEPLQTYVSSFFFSVIVFISLSINTIKNIRKRSSMISKKLNNERALFMGAIIGLLGVLSWLVLARGHSYVHAHINGIIFYLPYGLLLYTLLAIKLVKYFKKIKMIYVKK
jgi:H+/Cl- antiporter ClcA